MKSKPPTWKCKNMQEREQNCRIQLYINGLITESENEKIKQRMYRKALKELMNVQKRSQKR